MKLVKCLLILILLLELTTLVASRRRTTSYSARRRSTTYYDSNRRRTTYYDSNRRRTTYYSSGSSSSNLTWLWIVLGVFGFFGGSYCCWTCCCKVDASDSGQGTNERAAPSEETVQDVLTSLKQEKETKPCDSCGNKGVEFWCVEAEEAYCEACTLDVYINPKYTKDHHMISLQDTVPKDQPPTYPYQQNHPPPQSDGFENAPTGAYHAPPPYPPPPGYPPHGDNPYPPPGDNPYLPPGGFVAPPPPAPYDPQTQYYPPPPQEMSRVD